MIGVNYASRLKNLRCSGLVGMSRRNFDNRGSLFIEEMQKQGVIEKKMFSFYITNFF